MDDFAACAGGSGLTSLIQALAHQPALLVTVTATQGSAPREVGAWMAVCADRLLGSIGGGHLEWRACALARAWLQHGPEARTWPQRQRFALGPTLAQCCGGAVELDFDWLADPAAARTRPGLEPPSRAPVAIFGAGHVGQALVRALLPLPFALRWFDSRDGMFPARLPPAVQAELSDPVERAVPGLDSGSRVLILSHSHADDFELVAACLRRQRERADLAFIGLIGSRSKWASFRQRLRARGFLDHELERVTCPIGLSGIAGKQPAVIAACVAAQLLLSHPA